MLGVSLSSFDGLCTVTTKYLIKINEFSSFGFCNDDIWVRLFSPIVLCASELNQQCSVIVLLFEEL